MTVQTIYSEITNVVRMIPTYKGKSFNVYVDGSLDSIHINIETVIKIN